MSRIKETQDLFPAQQPKAVEPCPSPQPAAPPAQASTTAPVTEQQTAPPPQQQTPQEQKKKTWIKIELTDEAKQPVPGVKYRIKVPGEEKPREGVLDGLGQAAYFDLDPGNCEITFPELDGEAWEEI